MLQGHAQAQAEEEEEEEEVEVEVEVEVDVDLISKLSTRMLHMALFSFLSPILDL